MMITRTTVSCFHRETEFIRPLQRTKMFTSKRTLIALGPRRLGSDRENPGWFFFSFTVTTSQKIQIFAEEEWILLLPKCFIESSGVVFEGFVSNVSHLGFFDDSLAIESFDRCWLYSFKFDLDFQLSYVVYNIILWFGIDMQTWMEISNCPRWIG